MFVQQMHVYSGVRRVFHLPLSMKNECSIVFQRCPVEQKDIDAIRQWLDIFEDALIKEEVVSGANPIEPTSGTDL